MIVTDERVARFVSDRLGFALCPPYTAMGIERDNEVVAGVLFNQFEGADVHVTAAGSGWTLPFMRALGDYVYRQLGCERMTITTESETVAQYAERLGAMREGVLRNHFGKDRDAIIGGILMGDYRFNRSILASNSSRRA